MCGRGALEPGEGWAWEVRGRGCLINGAGPQISTARNSRHWLQQISQLLIVSPSASFLGPRLTRVCRAGSEKGGSPGRRGKAVLRWLQPPRTPRFPVGPAARLSCRASRVPSKHRALPLTSSAPRSTLCNCKSTHLSRLPPTSWHCTELRPSAMAGLRCTSGASGSYDGSGPPLT